MIDRRNLRAYHPFARLDRLLAEIEPEAYLERPQGAAGPVALQVGEPQHQPPDFVAEALAEAASGWSRYPPPRGTPEYLGAAAAWLIRRYDLPSDSAAAGGMLDPARALLPLPGTREGLFFAVLATVPTAEGGAPPVVLIPDPFYHVYAGAAAAAGAEPVFVPAEAERGFLPDFAALATETLERAAFCFLCTPSNPQGAVATRAYLGELITLARRHDFVVAFDECYAEIYNDEAPPGALQAALDLGGSLDNILMFHSLSKRSSAPGLRCGFVAGDPALIDQLDATLRIGGAGVPLPVLAAGARLWQEETHVAANRAHYQRNFAVAERVLGNRFGFRKPAGGFFLWLDVGDGEAAAQTLWRRSGIKVLPGAYMSSAAWRDAQGSANGASANGSSKLGPAAPYIRVALVFDPALTEAALGRIAEVLS